MREELLVAAKESREKLDVISTITKLENLFFFAIIG
jgi:hypothetical protein